MSMSMSMSLSMSMSMSMSMSISSSSSSMSMSMSISISQCNKCNVDGLRTPHVHQHPTLRRLLPVSATADYCYYKYQ